MELLTVELRNRLLENNSRARDQDHLPVVKLFLPGHSATWLISEMEQDGDTLFGLCDLGMGEPELGYVSLEELQSVRSRMGLAVERDLHWTARAALSVYASAARASVFPDGRLGVEVDIKCLRCRVIRQDVLLCKFQTEDPKLAMIFKLAARPI